ncbi:MAG: hypothetical protein OdinLCB4_002920 [Candidatus Odinarchaeum yellowstonii]|uniref:Uncharacterized protein n=1 Tax=Odinarchaeota yellowstonii (strain LCB_4) TaxID=1841599 RepID=A0AAF0D394_ODILC|nr:MAG: hypothetical protein OdinLCB4_002920 [Candidatus Odinarchaeum yellowstonii]
MNVQYNYTSTLKIIKYKAIPLDINTCLMIKIVVNIIIGDIFFNFNKKRAGDCVNKIFLAALLCGLIAFAFTQFPFQIRAQTTAQNTVTQPALSDHDDTPFKQFYDENETKIITVNLSVEVTEDGVITPGDNQTIWFKAAGGGYIYYNGYKNNFGFNVCFNNTLEGHLNYVNRAAGYHFKGLTVFNASTEVIENGYSVRVYGSGEIKGQTYIFKLEAVDKGEPSVFDEFHVWVYTDSGALYDYSGGVLSGGNINVNIQY